MSRPTHILRHEHRVIEQGLRALDGMCLTLKNGGSVPAGELSLILDFIQNFADRFHHEREESFLFPALSNSGIKEEDGALGFLKKEHQTERNLLAALELVIDEYRYGDETAADRFVATAKQFRDHLIEHMQKEESILFRLAEEIMDDETKDSLTRALIHVEGQESEALVQRYERLAGELEKNWTV